MNYEDLDESENVEDRRGEAPRGALDTIMDSLEDQGRYIYGRVVEGRNAAGHEPDNDDRRAHRREMGLDFEDGGPVEEESEYDSLAGPTGDEQTQSIASALKAVNEALMFGRQKLGLGGQKKPSFAEGGSVEDEALDETLPPQEQGIAVDEDVPLPRARPQSADIPVEGPEDQRGPVERSGYAPHQLIQRGGQMIMRYLQAADADPQLAQRAEMEVDPEGILDESTRKLLAVEHARSRGGTDASWKLVQNYRKKYDGYNAFAAAALQNNDLAGAARAASQAYPNMLDGSNITFEPGQNGVIANITQQGGQPRQVPLTAQQFGAWLSNSQYDNVLAKGGPAMLEALLQQQQGAPAAPQTQQPTPVAGQRPQVNRPARMQGGPQNGQLPGTDGNDVRPFAAPELAQRFPDRYRALPEGYQSPRPRQQSPDEERINRQYPWVSQGNERAAATERSLEREVKDARAQAPVQAAQIRGEVSRANAQDRGQTQRDVAVIRGNSYDQRTQAQYRAVEKRIEEAARRGGANEQLGRERNAVRIIQEKLRNGQQLSPQEQQVHEQIMRGAQGGAAPAPQAPAPQRQGQAPAQRGARPPGAAFQDQQGRFYDKFGRPL